jgi:hypothetical protein
MTTTHRIIRTRLTPAGLVTVHLSSDDQYVITGPDGFCEQYGGIKPHAERRLTRTQMSLLDDAAREVGEGIEFTSGSSVAITDVRVLAAAVNCAYQHVNGGEEYAESEFAFRALEKSCAAIEARWCQLQTSLKLELFWSDMIP